MLRGVPSQLLPGFSAVGSRCFSLLSPPLRPLPGCLRTRNSEVSERRSFPIVSGTGNPPSESQASARAHEPRDKAQNKLDLMSHLLESSEPRCQMHRLCERRNPPCAVAFVFCCKASSRRSSGTSTPRTHNSTACRKKWVCALRSISSTLRSMLDEGATGAEACCGGKSMAVRASLTLGFLRRRACSAEQARRSCRDGAEVAVAALWAMRFSIQGLQSNATKSAAPPRQLQVLHWTQSRAPGHAKSEQKIFPSVSFHLCTDLQYSGSETRLHRITLPYTTLPCINYTAFRHTLHTCRRAHAG